jgi:lysyl-tRNA synthetase class 2
MNDEKEQKKRKSADGGEDIKTDQEEAREIKLKKLVEKGIDLFPTTVEISHRVYDIVVSYSTEDKEKLEEQKIEVFVPGRILSIRRMGRATFFHISDSRSRLQVYLREDRVGKEEYDVFSLYDIGDMIAVRGMLFKTRTEELTVLADSFVLLAKCRHPLPEKWHGLHDVELRYRKRYLDLIVNPEVVDIFRQRSALITTIRKYFDDRGYVEVETPMMQPVPGGALARPFKTFHNALGIDLFLRIAPELYLKRLTVGGMDKVYEINRNFRNEGISAEHNPEFTMLEFYEAYSDYNGMIRMTEELIHLLCVTLKGSEEISFGEHTLSFKRPWKRMKFMEAVSYYSGLAPNKFDDKDQIVEFAATLISEQESLTFAKALDVIFDKCVKQNLIQPTFITHPPKDISPLAKASPENPEEAERFELVVAGMEIANAFSELTDPEEQRERFEQQSGEREKGDEESHRIDMDYVQALEYGLPPTGGEGIGIDRLVMLFSDKKSIREVILFPLMRPRD